MSLVHEALQKAEREKQRKVGVAPVPPSTTPVVTGRQPALPPPPATVPARQRAPVFVVGVVCLSVAVLAMIAWWVSQAAGPDRPAAKALTTETVASPARWAATPVAESPAAPTAGPALPAAYKVTGINRDPDGTYVAVINGRNFTETQFVDGAIVKRIERDRVTLEVNGREVVVRYF